MDSFADVILNKTDYTLSVHIRLKHLNVDTFNNKKNELVVHKTVAKDMCQFNISLSLPERLKENPFGIQNAKRDPRDFEIYWKRKITHLPSTYQCEIGNIRCTIKCFSLYGKKKVPAVSKQELDNFINNKQALIKRPYITVRGIPVGWMSSDVSDEYERKLGDKKRKKVAEMEERIKKEEWRNKYYGSTMNQHKSKPKPDLKTKGWMATHASQGGRFTPK